MFSLPPRSCPWTCRPFLPPSACCFLVSFDHSSTPSPPAHSFSFLRGETFSSSPPTRPSLLRAEDQQLTITSVPRSLLWNLQLLSHLHRQPRAFSSFLAWLSEFVLRCLQLILLASAQHRSLLVFISKTI